MTRPDRDRHDPLSVPEMLRIMDVATALRQDRELVEEQLNVEALKGRLKERMLAAAKVTGESVTPEEVDAAIQRYYAGLYTFREPKLDFPVAMAHLWVRRSTLLWAGWAAIASIAILWWLFLSAGGPLTSRGRNHRRVESLAASIAGQARDVRTLSADRSVDPQVDRLAAEAEVYRKRDDAAGLGSIRKALADLEGRLREEYAVTVVPGLQGKGSAVIRDFGKGKDRKLSGYYLIVEARAPDGSTLTRRVHDDETGTDEDVTTWGERVPEAVYERLKKDKLDDGILNETSFAVKRKGSPDETITMPGPDGKPLARLGRITAW